MSKKSFYKIKGRVQCFVQVFRCGYLCKEETGTNLAIVFLFNYTRKNAQDVTSLQTSCNKSVHKLLTSCVRTACS